MATSRADGGNFSQPRREFREIPFDLYVLAWPLTVRNFSHFLPEGWLRSSERNERLGIASDSLKLKPTAHRNEVPSHVKSHKAITTRVVTGPTTIACTSQSHLFLSVSEWELRRFAFCVTLQVSLVTRNMEASPEKLQLTVCPCRHTHPSSVHFSSPVPCQNRQKVSAIRVRISRTLLQCS